MKQPVEAPSNREETIAESFEDSAIVYKLVQGSGWI